MNNFSIPLSEVVNKAFDEIVPSITPITNTISRNLATIIDKFEGYLLILPPWIMIIVVGALVGFFLNKKLGIFTIASLTFLLGLELWSQTMSTLSLVLTGTIISLLIGIPLGILSSQSDVTERVLRPILDFMQTLPSFVYLIPAVMFFGLGKVSSLVAVLIFSMPPAVRLTNLGIRQVPKDMVEAARAFGSTRLQILLGVQLPLALSTIMAGVNQCIMMALSMSVIAAMIGGGGLGRDILRAMQTVDIGLGVESGIAIVLLAILLDRITENIAKSKNNI
ncbi:glycine betaine/proline transport system permease protein [Anaerovirgula multivorans]|uniref:Glycine betaine/proline transport system permease protein n=1 Tax=Anaerovirgula multivorans TaxID=312168 RepID=A0A239BT68_9FIRM|nr:proline/glycine betaine ABC transporter permease [Anaerovirgula multivorans]SNS11100.1 glycine betaine/proline transport system permease protein [Anaerovirgula multivorans]